MEWQWAVICDRERRARGQVLTGSQIKLDRVAKKEGRVLMLSQIGSDRVEK